MDEMEMDETEMDQMEPDDGQIWDSVMSDWFPDAKDEDQIAEELDDWGCDDYYG